MPIPAQWSGLSYREIHQLEAPWSGCECDHCEMMRELDEWDDHAWAEGFRMRLQTLTLRAMMPMTTSEANQRN